MLAPMEGVLDGCLRELLTAIGGIDRCVTEFVRITRQQLPERVFLRYCPELQHGSHTRYDVPVYLQLLGDEPAMMAANAAAAAELGAIGIDLNFGCPARSVNNHGGGAVLLQDPERLYAIARAVRDALPAGIPLSAKMRLGYADKSRALDNAEALQAAGVDEIAIHARTKTEGYQPPAYWPEIGKITARLAIPVIANGEIWTLDDLQRCMDESGSRRIMLGRGLIACPDLALLARGHDAPSLHWGEICLLLLYYLQQLHHCCDARHITSLIKQWLVYLRVHYADAWLFFDAVKTLRDPALMQQALAAELQRQQQLRPIRSRIGALALEPLLEQGGRDITPAATTGS